MGAPKQKWTPEEEAALKAGVVKHGAGKWRTILKDPEFSGVLFLRSNVDLKDKWRNMSVMANGWGSREKARLALRKVPSAPKAEENPLSLGTAVQSDDETVDTKALALPSNPVQITGSKRSFSRYTSYPLILILMFSSFRVKGAVDLRGNELMTTMT
ncbi:Telomere repeat-binding factor 1 [Vitis vinifera]|uniref:MYB transcription factor n=1 Tax=Vitis vinifera TaxID=29760 RepID=A0A438D794_VITVI|nr:Telomere repeat-binding factor 1 [Vitis vinifera]